MQDKSDVMWLTELVLGASKTVPWQKRPVSQGIIESPNGIIYRVAHELGKTDRYNLYHCALLDESFAVLKIASDKEFNSDLDREALIIKTMTEKAADIESQNRGEKPFNYQYFFPQLIESFISESQKDRRINVLGFPPEIVKLDQLVPLSSLVEKEKVRVDPRTSVWIIGKWLKVLAFAHDQGISNGNNTLSNLLIEKDEHAVILFDWTKTTLFQNYVPQAYAQEEIKMIGHRSFLILGGDVKKGILPASDQLIDDQYADFLKRLANGRFNNAADAHEQFYKLVFALWPRRFHDFTVFPLES